MRIFKGFASFIFYIIDKNLRIRSIAFKNKHRLIDDTTFEVS